MATAADLRKLALGFEGTTEAPHFERMAYRAVRIYATVPPDGQTANLALAPDQQALKCAVAPEAFKPIDNAWGRRGWTTVTLAALSKAELEAALRMAWEQGREKKGRRR